jgi:hypothetical protein
MSKNLVTSGLLYVHSLSKTYQKAMKKKPKDGDLKTIAKKKFSYKFKMNYLKNIYSEVKFTEDDLLKSIEKDNSESISPDINKVISMYTYQKPEFASNIGNRISSFDFKKVLGSGSYSKDMTGFKRLYLESLSCIQINAIVKHYNNILSDPVKIQKCNFASALFIYKNKKDPVEVKAFRPIITIPLLVKQLHRIIHTRLSTYLISNNYLDTNVLKGGIPKISHGVNTQIMKIKYCLRDALENKKPLVLIFLDISNAFGNIDLNVLLEIMKKYHIDDTTINYIKNFYTDFVCYYVTKKWTSRNINLTRGIIQGCPLSTCLFNMCMNYIIMSINQEHKTSYGYEIKITNKQTLNIMFTNFIDDNCIILKGVKEADAIYNQFKTKLTYLGLPLSEPKSAIMTINIDRKELENTKYIKNLKVVDTWVYLGSVINSNNQYVEYIEKLMKNISSKLKIIENTKKISVEYKLKIITSVVIPYVKRELVLLPYGNVETKRKIIAIVQLVGRKIYNLCSEEVKKRVKDPTFYAYSSVVEMLKASQDEFIRGIISTVTDAPIEKIKYGEEQPEYVNVGSAKLEQLSYTEAMELTYKLESIDELK